jgi:hypothetical protein
MSQKGERPNFFSEKILTLKAKTTFANLQTGVWVRNFSKIFRMAAKKKREQLTSICQGALRISVIQKGLRPGVRPRDP